MPVAVCIKEFPQEQQNRAPTIACVPQLEQNIFSCPETTNFVEFAQKKYCLDKILGNAKSVLIKVRA